MTGPGQPWHSRCWTQRRRFAPAVLAVGVVVIGYSAQGAVPREVRVRYEFGPDHALVTGVSIRYFEESEEVHRVRYSYPEGAPFTVDHELHLPSGRYELQALVKGRQWRQLRPVQLVVPAEGRVHIRLFDEAFARAPTSSYSPN